MILNAKRLLSLRSAPMRRRVNVASWRAAGGVLMGLGVLLVGCSDGDPEAVAALQAQLPTEIDGQTFLDKTEGDGTDCGFPVGCDEPRGRRGFIVDCAEAAAQRDKVIDQLVNHGYELNPRWENDVAATRMIGPPGMDSEATIFVDEGAPLVGDVDIETDDPCGLLVIVRQGQA